MVTVKRLLLDVAIVLASNRTRTCSPPEGRSTATRAAKADAVQPARGTRAHRARPRVVTSVELVRGARAAINRGDTEWVVAHADRGTSSCR
jgi:hypothetical protein